jgi:hypothetical protein
MNTKRRKIKFMYRFRFLNRIYAALNGYCWLPCKRCGTSYGGHEIYGASINNRMIGENSFKGTCICPKCHVELVNKHNWTMFDDQDNKFIPVITDNLQLTN